MIKSTLTGAALAVLMTPLLADQPVSHSGWVPDPNSSPPASAPLPCDGGNCPTGTSYTFFTDENEFLDVLEAGFYDEDFAGIPVGDAGPSLSFGGNGFSYTVTAYGNGSGLLFNDPGLLSLESQLDTMRISFTGTPVLAVGGNLFATDFDFVASGGPIVLTLDDGSTETLATSSATTFAGFVTSSPIVFIDIAAPNDIDQHWPAVNQLYVGVPVMEFSISGSLSGLAAGNSIVLQNNGGDELNLINNGNFTFNTPIIDGESYLVTVLTQPEDPNQICTVVNGSGEVNGADVTDIVVDCVTETYTIGGTVSGLADGAVALQNHGGDDLILSSNGNFTFDTPLSDGESYLVTVLSQPEGPNQVCTVVDGSGEVNGADVADIAVDCVTETYTIGGTVSGLADGTVVLQNNGGDDLAIGANGVFSFSTALDDGSDYEITVSTQPEQPDQICRVENATGTLAGFDVENVEVACFGSDLFADRFES